MLQLGFICALLFLLPHAAVSTQMDGELSPSIFTMLEAIDALFEMTPGVESVTTTAAQAANDLQDLLAQHGICVDGVCPSLQTKREFIPYMMKAYQGAGAAILAYIAFSNDFNVALFGIGSCCVLSNFVLGQLLAMYDEDALQMIQERVEDNIRELALYKRRSPLIENTPVHVRH